MIRCAPNNTIDSLEVWKIDNLEVTGIYERRAVGLLRVSAWVDPADIEGGTIEDVSKNGFSFSQSGGMLFETGVLRLVGTPKGEYSERVMLYTEVAVGRPFVYDGNPGMRRVPGGYDSFYIPSQPLDRNNDGQFSLEEYHAAAQFDGRDPRWALTFTQPIAFKNCCFLLSVSTITGTSSRIHTKHALNT